MKKVVLASLLAVAIAVPMTPLFAQAPGIQMSADEYAVYNAAATATTPADKAAKFEAYLKAYPASAVKLDVLNQILYNYSQVGDPVKVLDASDKLLAVDPGNLRALTFEVYYRRQDGDKITDVAAKCPALDVAAGYAQKGLDAPKPKDMADADFAKIKSATTPTFESAIADDDICKKDSAGAITALTAEITGAPDQTMTPSPVLQDVFTLANVYYNSTPPDFLNCTWYATRAAAYAGSFAAQIQPLATYCYKKYHGNADGYDKLQALVKTSLTPPADLSKTVTAAPKPEDIVANLIATTPDLATLAISDKEFVLQYGKPSDADKVFETVKGKSTQFPAVTVMDGSTVDSLKLAVTDDAAASKTADFTFAMKEPLKTLPAVGTKIDVEGTYASYTQTPLMIMMTDGALVEKKPVKKPVTHAPVHHK